MQTAGQFLAINSLVLNQRRERCHAENRMAQKHGAGNVNTTVA